MKIKWLYALLILIIFSCGKENEVIDHSEVNEEWDETDVQIYNWLSLQQLSNGLLESAENSNIVSLYDNALAAIVFVMQGDYTKAEKIFDFFNDRIDTELKNGGGGFSQFRDTNGTPNKHRWMGDNAWLLIALNNYTAKTGRTTYAHLAEELSDWLQGLQQEDGGLFSGYDTNGKAMEFKVTEGNIDAFNAIKGYTEFHRNLLQFLKTSRWDNTDKNLMAQPQDPTYKYALDLHAWGYLIFEDFPTTTLTTANRYLTTQTTIHGLQITGYCFDTDRDVVWLEGTGQMALAFGIAGMNNERMNQLTEVKKNIIESKKYPKSIGFPYASNSGTTYGSGDLWSGADSNIAISGGAWYLLAKKKFDPFAVGRNKNIPDTDKFWIH